MSTKANAKINEQQQQLMERIKQIRRDLHMRQNDVADASGVSREAYLRAENGLADMRLSTLIAVLKGMGYELQFVRTDAVEQIAREAHARAEERKAQAKKLREREEARSSTFTHLYGGTPKKATQAMQNLRAYAEEHDLLPKPEFDDAEPAMPLAQESIIQTEQSHDQNSESVDSRSTQNVDDEAVPQVQEQSRWPFIAAYAGLKGTKA